MKLALIQQKASQDLLNNLDRGISALQRAADEGADLVVYPELAFLPFFPQWTECPQAFEWAETIPGPTTDRFRKKAADLGVNVVINLFEREGGRYYDSSPIIGSDGSLLAVARMVHIIEAPCFHEQAYYTPGDRGAVTADLEGLKLGVAICYDRHYPEYMRSLGVQGAQLVVVPQAGSVGEWPEGVFEAELQIAGFQNGYFTALANRVGQEPCLNFAGESFVTDPLGRVIARAPSLQEHILYAELDLDLLKESPARKHFLKDRRAEVVL